MNETCGFQPSRNRKNWTSTVLNSNCARSISVEIWYFGKDNIIAFYKKKKKKKGLQNWEGNFLDNTTSIHFCFWLTHWQAIFCVLVNSKWEFLITHLHRGYSLIYVANLIRIAYIFNFLNKIISQALPYFPLHSFILSTYIYHQSFIGKFCINKYLPIETLILTVPIWVQRMTQIFILKFNCRLASYGTLLKLSTPESYQRRAHSN